MNMVFRMMKGFVLFGLVLSALNVMASAERNLKITSAAEFTFACHRLERNSGNISRCMYTIIRSQNIMQTENAVEQTISNLEELNRINREFKSLSALLKQVDLPEYIDDDLAEVDVVKLDENVDVFENSLFILEANIETLRAVVISGLLDQARYEAGRITGIISDIANMSENLRDLLP